VFNEGYVSVPVPPYPIPYRCLTPSREDAENLLVPVCVSASHVAFSSLRMEPTYMLLGHAAGIAAAQAARDGVAVQDVDIDELQQSLRDEGQVLSL
jgi:FAD dependent oxidoreductase